MMDNNKSILDQTTYHFDKAVENYSDEKNNYVIPYELTVTITLNEYRELLTAKSKAIADDAISEKWKKESEIKELKERIKTMETTIDTLRGIKHCEAEDSEKVVAE